MDAVLVACYFSIQGGKAAIIISRRMGPLWPRVWAIISHHNLCVTSISATLRVLHTYATFQWIDGTGPASQEQLQQIYARITRDQGTLGNEEQQPDPGPETGHLALHIKDLPRGGRGQQGCSDSPYPRDVRPVPRQGIIYLIGPGDEAPQRGRSPTHHPTTSSRAISQERVVRRERHPPRKAVFSLPLSRPLG